MSRKPANPILAALHGAVLAVIICFALSYVGVLTGLVNPTSPAGPRESFGAGLSRATLNVYAMQHVTLRGQGTVSDALMGNQTVSDTIVLPLTLGFIIPALALLIGGYFAGADRRGSGVAGVVLPAVLGGIIYAGVLALICGIVHAKLDPSAIPAVGDISFNPHDIALSPDRLSALLSGCLFGIFYSYLGAMVSCRKERIQGERGVWWGPVKAVFWVSLIFQLVVMVGFGWLLVNRGPSNPSPDTSPARMLSFAPAISGAAQGEINGLTLAGSLESPMQPEGAIRGTANVYTGMATAGLGKQPTPIPAKVKLIAAGVAAVCAFLIGLLAFVWGSRDGAFPAAFRSTVLMAMFLAATSLLCAFGWTSREGEIAMKFLVQMRAGWPVAISVIGFLIFALIGASFAGLFCKRRSAAAPAK